MLTKDLLRFRIIKGTVKPQFVDTGNATLLQLAEELLTIYRQPGVSRAEIADVVEPALNFISDRKLACGLEKLLQDRAKFEHADDVNFAEHRGRMFADSANLLRRAAEMSFEAYREQALADAGDIDIYQDLPENERLVRFRDLYPQQLLERYNCAQVQSLLLQAQSLTLTIDEPEAANLRRLMKYLKFFRLLATIHRDDTQRKKKAADESRLRIVIDGPASVLGNTGKYGLQLASFFPAVCSLSKWRLETTVSVRNGQEVRLVADQKLGLVSAYRNFSAYVPEEIGMFHRHFRETVGDWTIVGETPFIDSGDQELVFPDFSFENSDGGRVHLELFHRWHGTQLLQRLVFGAANPDLPLIIGVDRSLLSKPEIEGALEGSGWFAANGFLFRDYPTVNKVRKCLENRVACANL